MFITNNHLRFNCVERKIWPNIKKSQNIMTMIVDSSFRHSKTPKDIYKLFSAFFRKIFCRGWAIKGMSYYNDMWSKSEMKLRLTLSWRRPLSYRNQSTDLRSKSMDWFLYDNGLRHERINSRRLIFTNVQVDSFWMFW